ncbi:MAG: hypothetical protein JSW39_28200 [Desulfobacterales bacterium]|nr:MAG: hypothetical protein JSW39_28200 [Desulfobacterales bacterium]
MNPFSGIEKRFSQIVDYFFAIRPQPMPSKKRLLNCKIVSHRGEHDNIHIFENTIAAFDRAQEQGVWGIELDVRWTKDLEPVVFHDPDLMRLFGSDLAIRHATQSTLRSNYPLIPSLAEVIQRYGFNLHLMVEIKAEDYPNPVRQNQILKELFTPLRPQEDFHILSLTPAMFKVIDFVPPSTFLPVARLNVSRLSKMAILEKYRGLAGHYLLVNRVLLTRHQQRHQKVGTGYIASRNCLFRELNRGVEWIFSNTAGKIQAICDSLLQNP